MRTSNQDGMLLIEALIAILIFALGILGMIAMAGTAVSAQSDAQYRTQAGELADAIVSEIALSVDRTSDATTAASLVPFVHQEDGGDCVFTGDETPNLPVLALVHKAGNAPVGEVGLPGATTANQQILVDAVGQYNRVTVTLCWKTPSDAVLRRHTVVSYIN